MFIGGLGFGLLLGNEFTGSYITIIGAILMLIAIGSMILISYNKKMKDNDLKPGSKAYDEIGDLTKLSYELRDRNKDKDKVK